MQHLPIRIAIFVWCGNRAYCLAKGVQGEGGERVNLSRELSVEYPTSDYTKNPTSGRLETFPFVGRFRVASRCGGPRREGEAKRVRFVSVVIVVTAVIVLNVSFLPLLSSLSVLFVIVAIVR